MTFVLSGLVAAVLAIALVTLAERRQRAGYRGADGWTVLRPGWLIKFAILLCTVLTAVIGWFLWSGGSTRADAATQNLYALGLMLFFAVGAVHVVWAAYSRTIAWNAEALRIGRALRGETVRSIAELASAERIDARSEYRLTFRDGSKLGISTYFDGARELIERLPPGVYREPKDNWS